MSYNGWTNQATWLLTLWFDIVDFREHLAANDITWSKRSADEKQTIVRDYVMDQLPLGGCDMVSDFVELAVADIDWGQFVCNWVEQNI